MEEFANYQEHIDKAIEWAWKVLPDVIMATIILVFGLWIIRFINKMVRKFFEKKDYDLALESFLQSFINIALKVLLFVLVVTQLGVKSSSLIAIIGAAGLAIGLALQGSLSNFAGGVLILLFKPFKIGDFISAQGVDGTVKEITIFYTKLTTFGNQLAIIPNGELSNNNVVNYSAMPTRRDNIKVGIGYSSNIKTAKEIMLDICAKNENVLKDPMPEVYVDGLGDSSVDLTLRYWAENPVFWAAHFFIIEEIKRRFDEAGIEIPFPQRDVHVKGQAIEA
ncbi:mechanosensitive ion channel [Zobellia galactanivorans]|uniref:Mechanosensitive ion channel n=1 Tax=Zobellia galactanivorans (strain DSM 12802 / CCUG 47099 / CIP 106680 / NCIMB 13871 / Dsij) TaxID=63186 RepID=G0LC08_ZOBGA|nr:MULTISPECIES: mechanosensitive ion channel domain-containing protein [Zobellia]MBU3027817.1 mechanosensitive ion channel [Zobellia galactanivorans]MDO6517492.1 mechanosensitive ion channel [Zobellia uliginosa]MDO6807200.1 mechanosensitive ion channel [Zobellia galactanivorans]CAZ96551.1 Mechanosensitive ion channel [Zobellia galactanivorans]